MRPCRISFFSRITTFSSTVSDYPDAWVPLDDVDINWDDFSAEKLDYSTIDGVHYGVPVDNGTVVCAYRVDLLEQQDIR